MARGVQCVELVLQTAASAEDEMSAVLNEVEQMLTFCGGDEVKTGSDDQLVGIERGRRIHDVDAVGEFAKRRVERTHVGDGIEILVMTLEVDGPAVVVGMQ